MAIPTSPVAPGPATSSARLARRIRGISRRATQPGCVHHQHWRRPARSRWSGRHHKVAVTSQFHCRSRKNRGDGLMKPHLPVHLELRQAHRADHRRGRSSGEWILPTPMTTVLKQINRNTCAAKVPGVLCRVRPGAQTASQGFIASRPEPGESAWRETGADALGQPYGRKVTRQGQPR